MVDAGGPGWLGSVDVWVAVDGGWLAAMHVDGRDPSVPAQDAEDARAFTDVRVSGINDARNQIDEPVVPPPTPRPTGDPAVMALLDAAEKVGRTLDAWEMTTEEQFAGGMIRTTQAFVRAPRVSYSILTGDEGGTQDAMIAIGDEAWSQKAGKPWTPTTADDMGCTGSRSIARCVLETSAVLPLSIGAERETFSLLGDEILDGVGVVHLRSTAGLPDEYAPLPATVDVWLAKDGGHLVRVTIQTDDGTSRIDVTRVNDPTLTIERPVP